MFGPLLRSFILPSPTHSPHKMAMMVLVGATADGCSPPFFLDALHNAYAQQNEQRCEGVADSDEQKPTQNKSELKTQKKRIRGGDSVTLISTRF